jgi:ribosomal-protein-alanine N-acetyltransferase
MILEPARGDEADLLAQVHARSFPTGWSAADISALIAQPGSFTLVAREGPGVLAFLLGRAVAGEAEVLTLAVDPAQRRRGLARGLVEAAALAAEAAGAEALFLEVAADNIAAIGLYEGAGFLRIGARPGYYRREDGMVDALVLRRDLNTRAG